MMMLRSVALLAALILIWPMSASGQEKRPQLLKGSQGKPIQIVSDRLDAYREKELVQFSGNVVATQEDRVIKSDTLMLFFKKKAEPRKAGVGAATEGGDIDRIEAKGHVRITEKDRIVTGESAIYYNDDQKIVVTGDPVMREGNNVITGDRVIVLLDENRGIVESNAGKRVSATIYPDELKEKKEKKP